MLPSMDPKQLAGLMRQMGIKNEMIPADRVEITRSDGSKIVIENPQVIQIDMKGQKSFQINGDVTEANAGSTQETDADLVMNETGCTREQAERALSESDGDLAEAILKLKKD